MQGTETYIVKQIEAIAKSPDVAKETGVLGDRGMLLSGLLREAEKVQTGGMYGLMAGQAGHLQEYMMQRGMLPQAIGSMSAADRVELMSGDMNEETIRRLARQEAVRELTLNSEEFNNASGNPAKQQEIIDANIGTYADQIRNTHTAIKNFGQAGGSSDIAQLEELGGFNAIASDVAARRPPSAVHKYAADDDAVREIFGANGNPNAPMPALLAALDQLSQGANFQVDPKSLETSLRSMQLAAREAGVGF